MENKYKNSKQVELFDSKEDFSIGSLKEQNVIQAGKSITEWRDKIYHHQSNILKSLNNSSLQQQIIPETDQDNIKKINPFLYESFSINFWRTNKKIHHGPAMYFVFDKFEEYQIILYIGETLSADKRWKGVHDCKFYIQNYKEELAKNHLDSHLDIRFYFDVPKAVNLRRKLEQKLIYLWLPPFNKETKNRWTTTFTNN